MTLKELEKIKRNYLKRNKYSRCFYGDFDYKILDNIMYKRKFSRYNNTFNDCIIMLDTETSKKEIQIHENVFEAEYNTIKNTLKNTTFLLNRNYFETYSRNEFIKLGIKFSKKGCSFDTFFYKLIDRYPYLFEYKNEYYNLNELANFLEENEPPEIPDTAYHNHIVLWTISIRAMGIDIVTLYGRKPSECVECLNKINHVLQGKETYIFIHNMSYDWWFLRKFFIKEWGEPEYQLNTKPHYPIMINFANGLQFRDSLILAQCSLEKWAKQLNVEVEKQVGFWDYDVLRDQDTPLTDKEFTYAEYDTLVGVHCLDALCKTLNCNISMLPHTSTGIIRRDLKKLAKENNQRQAFLKVVPNFEQYHKLYMMYHGGYTHANFDSIGFIYEDVEAYDFASSYPFVMLSEKYPAEAFTDYGACSINDIIQNVNDYAFMIHVAFIDIDFNDKYIMPSLQESKCVKIIDGVLDSGRVVKCAYAEIYITEMDLLLLQQHYELNDTNTKILECEFAYKDYLPRWLTDYIFKRFEIKTRLKGIEDKKTEYAIEKTKINGIYGVHVQKSIQEEIKEIYDVNEYEKEKLSIEKRQELYQKYVESPSHYLPYQWGVWVTAYAMYNLFTLGSCCDNWLYSDTDSCYGTLWNKKKLQEYNQNCIRKLHKNGYGGVDHNGKTYYLGVAEADGKYKKFKTLGAKKYCVLTYDDKIKITVAGVPKKEGSKCIKSIEEFQDGFIFKGEDTGKLTHTYYGVEKIYIDDNGNETGDSINLYPCDYELSDSVIQRVDFKELLMEELEVSYIE